MERRRSWLFVALGIAALGSAGAAIASKTSYYATCEMGHPYWKSGVVSSYSEAASYGQAHDREMHRGQETATVIDRNQ